MIKKTLMIGLAAFSLWLSAHAQLAITEIQTGEIKANTLGSGVAVDWWELKNFSPNDINLTGYSWSDGSHAVQSADRPFDAANVVIHAGETIVIMESNNVINSADVFRQWWGPGVGADVQIIVSTTPNGLSKSGEAVRLWFPGAYLADASDPNNTAGLVDRVDVGAEPTTGIPSFIYDPNNGTFDWFSTNGVGGAFTAATSTDVGSPGIAPDASPIVLTQQPGPANYTIPLNTPVTYTISGYGLPKPKFQWLFNGQPVDTNALGAVIVTTISNNLASSTLTIPSVQTVDAGTFSATASNGVQVLNSSNSLLNVTTTPSAPTITAFAPNNLTAYVGQTIMYAVTAFGSPSPTYQWKINGTNINGQNGPQFQLILSNTNQSGTYTVVLNNSAGSTNASTTLLVTPKPDLRITEAMSAESTNTDTGDPANHSDWWELSNFGTFAVNLQGYRFNDNHDVFSSAFTITNNITIQPGESIILVEGMTPDAFRTWWGSQLRANVQIITYPSIGFGSDSDAITVWNAAAAVEGDYIDSVSFSTATAGFSFGYDPNPGDGNFGFLGFAPDGLSIAGSNGAFVAAVGGDVGSPGTVLNVPNFNSITQTNGAIALTWTTQPNWTNLLQFKNSLTDAHWMTLTNFISDSSSTANFMDTATNAQRYYRVLLNLNQ